MSPNRMLSRIATAGRSRILFVLCCVLDVRGGRKSRRQIDRRAGMFDDSDSFNCLIPT